MVKKILTVLIMISILALLCTCKSEAKHSPRYTFHKLCDNKIIIIDQETGAIVGHEFDITTYSPDALYFLDLEWPEKKE